MTRYTWSGPGSATYGLDPDPLQVVDEPLDPDASTIPDPAAWEDDADDDSGPWFGCLMLAAAFMAGVVTAVIVGRWL